MEEEKEEDADAYSRPIIILSGAGNRKRVTENREKEPADRCIGWF